METLIQILMAMLGTLSFSLLFHLKRHNLLPAALGGGLGWGIYLLLVAQCSSIPLALLLTTAVVSMLGEIFARVFKTPAITFSVPMLIPMIPGGDLYYATSYLVRQDMTLFRQQLVFLLKEAGAMALGILLVACLMHLPWKIRLHRRKV